MADLSNPQSEGWILFFSTAMWLARVSSALDETDMLVERRDLVVCVISVLASDVFMILV